MQNRNWLKSNRQQRRLFDGWITRLLLKMPRLPEVWVFGVIAIVLMLSLTGCATRLPALCPEQVLPPVPALTEPIPPESYSLRAQQSLSKWEASLTATPVTP